MVLYPLLPESPHFLAVNGRLLEAQVVLNVEHVVTQNQASVLRCDFFFQFSCFVSDGGSI